MRRLTSWSVLIVAPILVGCGSVRDYDTKAQYDAPKSGYRIDVATKGSLPMGQDHNPAWVGTATITPLGGAGNPTLKLEFTGTADEVTYAIGAAAPVTAPWDDGTRSATLGDLLVKVGYKAVAADELEESAMVITGAMHGPKQTMMPGQSKALKVGLVTFR